MTEIIGVSDQAQAILDEWDKNGWKKGDGSNNIKLQTLVESLCLSLTEDH